MVVDLIPGAAWSRSFGTVPDAVVYGNRIWFPAAVPDVGKELVVSDGTAAGTTWFDLVPGVNSGNPGGIALSGDRLFFAAMDLTNGRELWAVDLSLINDAFESGDTSAWSYFVP